jgi:NAD(P)-dependent dehydrogenase (short-subunit alcohol dehydrogenase family)
VAESKLKNGSADQEVAIVTGAGRGFGRAIALRLARQGYAIAVISRTASEVSDTASLITAAGGRAAAFVADVTSPRDVERVISEIELELGAASLLVSNAGQADPFGPIGIVDERQWWQAMSLHVRAPMLLASAVLGPMRERGKGRIIFVASRAGREMHPNLSAYSIGKGAQIRLAEYVARETDGQGIAVFAIEPGTVLTRMAARSAESPDAAKWLPGFVAHIDRLKDQDPEAGLARCADRCAELASGRYDGLSGRFLQPEDDLELMVEAASPAPSRRLGGEAVTSPASADRVANIPMFAGAPGKEGNVCWDWAGETWLTFRP